MAQDQNNCLYSKLMVVVAEAMAIRKIFWDYQKRKGPINIIPKYHTLPRAIFWLKKK